jgi:hypothetical protein
MPSATRKTAKKFSCSAFMKRIHQTMKKKKPSATMADVHRRLKALERSIADPASKF